MYSSSVQQGIKVQMYVVSGIVITVFSKPDKTVLAILLMRLFIKSDGAIRPVHHGGYTPSSMEESVSELHT